jgi:SAM-dependent methyltransferase
LLCGSQQRKTLIESQDVDSGPHGLWFPVVQCQECGLCYTCPRPSLDTIGHFYPAIYEPHRTVPRASWRWRPSPYPDVPWHGQGRLLDFGCGGGAFLQRMHRQGWQVTGIEIADDAVERIRVQLGLQVLAGTLPHPDLQPESFDVLTMWQSLEHVHAPRDVLRAAHELLAPGGLLFATVPNIDSLGFRWFGADWYALDLPRHLCHFTAMTLPVMLERSGFQVMHLEMLRHSDWLRCSIRRARERRRLPFWQRWLLLRPLARLVTWYARASQQSDSIFVIAGKQ